MSEFWTQIRNFFTSVSEWLDFEIGSIGESSITLWTIIYSLIGIVLITWISGWLKRIISRRITKRYEVNEGTVNSIATIVRYGVLILGIMIVIQSAGIDLSALSVMAGALGVGIGFGLQNVTNNFISGLIILFEQPIKVGDRVTVGSIEGDVISIAMRATTVVTNENITLIIPNSEFISNTVTNWSHNDRMVALKFDVGVSYGSDAEQVREVLMEVMNKEEGILKDPAPRVLFKEFGDSSLNFILWVYTTEYTARPGQLRSNLYFNIFKKFKEVGIEIPFPQRDLHIRSSEVPFS